ncbi:hypothetical protein ACFLZ1_00715 [Patescibacteria group bacterium]
MIKIVPNILTDNLKEVRDKLLRLHNITCNVHVDIIDGKFINNATIKLDDLKKEKLISKFNVWLHLMVKDPMKFISEAKKNNIEYIIAQIEMMKDQKMFIKKCKEKKLKAGLALNYESSVKDINSDLLSQLDVILVMTIKAGWSGQELKKERLKEITKLWSLKQKKGFTYKIAVDGGVNKKTIPACVQAGAEVLFMHSAVWKNKDILKAYNGLQELANNNIRN